MTEGMSFELAEWLESKRAIPSEIAAECGLTTVNGRLAFEFRRSGRLCYRKIRIPNGNGEKSFARDRKDAETCMFLEDRIEDDPDLSSPLVITEGELDAVSCVVASIPNVVSVPDGAQLDQVGEGKIVPAHDKAFGWLWDDNGLKPHLARFDRVILAVDADRKGTILREELAVRFGRNKCYVVTYPEGCKDANDVLVKHGPQAVADLIAKASPLVPDKLCRFSDIRDEGTGEVYSTGFKGLDEGLGTAFIAPELVIITGQPGSGKSEFATVLGANLANFHKIPGAILQFEDRAGRVRETLIRYAMSSVNGISTREEAREWIDKWFLTIEPDQNLKDDHDYTLDYIKEVVREARTRHGCRWIILDPWNEIEHIWDRAKNESQYTNDALRALKKLARANQVILMIVAHPSKEGGRQSEIQDMDLYGISGSAAWANKADHGFIVHRSDKSKEDLYVKVAKSKDHVTMGGIGICRMQYRWNSAQYKYIGMGV